MIAAMLLAALICFDDVTIQMEVFDGYVRDDGASLGCGATCFGFDYPGCTDATVTYRLRVDAMRAPPAAAAAPSEPS